MNIEKFKAIKSLSKKERQKKIAEFTTDEEMKQLNEMTKTVNKISVVDGRQKDEK